MTRHSAELLAHCRLVPKLLDAIEVAGRAALAARELRTQSDFGPTDTLAFPPRTVHAALAQELGQTPEALRVEMSKWRGSRVPGAKKIVRLVDAASRLGWLDSAAAGSGAERLVAWCRDEVLRLEAAAKEVSLRQVARARGEAAGVVDTAVRGALGRVLEEQAEAVASSLVLAAAEAVETHFLAEYQPLAASRVLVDVSQRLSVVAQGLMARAEAMRREDDENRAVIVDELNEAERAHMLFSRTSTPEAQARLREVALRLGIGAGRLERILSRLETGVGLTADEMLRREELLDEYVRLRPPSEWIRFQASSMPIGAKKRTLADVKRKRAARPSDKK